MFNINISSNNCSSISSTLFSMLRSSQHFTTMMLNRSDLAGNYIELPTCGTRQPNSTQPLRFGNLAIIITYHAWSSSFKMLTMATTTMLTMMKMITRSSPRSPPLPSPPQDPWTGDPVLRSSTTISPFQGFYYDFSCHYFDKLDC